MRALTCLLISALFLSACAPRDEISISRTTADEPTLEAGVSCEAVFTYAANNPLTVNLILYGEPVLLNNTYLRLTGLVIGPKRLALMDAGGKVVVGEAGKEMNGYRIVKILDDAVKLERRK